MMNFCAVLFFLKLISHFHEVLGWNLVKRLHHLTENDSQQCERYCIRDNKCAAYKLRFPFEDNYRSRNLVDCFLFSSSFLNGISMKIKPVIASYTGYKLEINDSLNTYRSQNLILHTLATDSTSVLSFPQHFFRGCSYTISLWVWLWRSKKQSSQESSIFTTRSVYPPRDPQSSLFPTVLTNVGLHRDRFFFSLVRDNEGFYSGFSPKGSEVKYHEWTHIAMVIRDNLVEIYINGEYIDYVIAYSQSMSKSCPYSNNLVNDFSDKNLPDHFSDNINNTILQVMGGRGLRSTVGMVQQLFIVRGRALTAAEISAFLLERPVQRSRTFNQLMRVYGIVSLDGLCFWPNFEAILESYYMSVEWGLCPASVCGLVCIDEAIIFQGPRDPLSAMAREILLNNSTNSLIASGKGLSESFTSNLVMRSPNSSQRLLPAVHPSIVRRSSASLSLPASAFRPTPKGSLPAIGYTPLMAGKKRDGNNTQFKAANSSGASYTKMRATALRWLYLFLLGERGKVNPPAEGEQADLLGPLEDKGDSGVSESDIVGDDADINSPEYDYYEEYGNAPYDDYDYEDGYGLVYDYDEYDEVIEQEDTKTQQSSPGKSNNGREVNSSARAMRYAKWMNRQQSEREVFFLRDREGRIQSLYRMAMEWLSGRDSSNIEEQGFETNLETDSCPYPSYCYINANGPNFCRNDDTRIALHDWALYISEKARAALWLALFLADDIAGSSPGDGANDEPWAFSYPSMLGQPIHAALAVLSGSGRFEDLSVPASLAVNQSLLTETLGGYKLENLIGRQSHDEKAELISKNMSFSVNDTASKSLDDADWLNLLSLVDPTLEQLEEALSNPDYLPQLQPLIREANISSTYLASLAKSQGSHSKEYLDTQKEAFNMSVPSRLSYVDCMAAAAHYFPLTQYVVSHFGSVDTGVGYLEEVRLLDMHMYTLTSSPFSSSSSLLTQGYGGEEDLLHQHTEAEALTGDPAAQTWLGKRYFWGMGGLQPDEEQARQWFERAAQQGDAEALYNIGVFHELGQGGYQPDKNIALEYYKRAANASIPFHMALHALGNHYLYHPTEANHTLARQYYLRAAEKDSPEALFSLAMMHKEGVGGPVSIPRTVFYLTLAANKGHLRSLNYLAHGLFDVDSWLHAFDREFKLLKRSKELMRLVGSNSTLSGISVELEILLEMDYESNTSTQKTSNSSASFNASTGKDRRAHTLPTWLRYDAKKQLQVLLPEESVRIPFPISSPEDSCRSALPMLKYLADMFYRTKDLTRAALAAYIKKDLWLALELFDEAANLGVLSAQENAAYLYDQLMRVECPAYPLDVMNSMNGSWLGMLYKGARGLLSSFRTLPWPTAQQKLQRTECELFFTKLAIRRWIQLANTGDLTALRKVAEAISNQPVLSEQGFPPEMHAFVSSLKERWKNALPLRNSVAEKRKHRNGSNKKDMGHNVHLGDTENTQAKKKMEMQIAAQLFAAAASQGDVQSMIGLGWILFAGEDKTGMQRNLSAASHAFSWAIEYELLWATDLTYGTTYGLAPAIALLTTHVVKLFSCLQSWLYSFSALCFHIFKEFFLVGLVLIIVLSCVAFFMRII